MAKRKGGTPEVKPLSRAKLERTLLAQATQEDLADPEGIKAYFREEPLAPAAAKFLDDDEAFLALVEKAKETAPTAAEVDAGTSERPHDIGWILQDALDLLLPLADKAERTGLNKKDADEARWRLDELSVAYSALRWTLLHGEPPTREDWGGTEPANLGWPTVALVEELYESFDKLHAVTGITESKVGEGFAALQEATSKAAEAETRARAVLAEAEAEAARRRELARQVEQAKGKADAERRATLAAEGRAERAEARVRELEGELAARPRIETEARPAEDDDANALRAENASLRAHVEQLAAQVAALQAELDDERRRAAYVPGEEPAAQEDDGPADDGTLGSHYAAIRDRIESLPEPDSVRHAVDLAAGGLTPHLVYAPRAYESADDSPFRSPKIVLSDLVKIDRLAEMYLRGDVGTSLHDISRELNLDWVEDSNAADHGVRGRFYRYDHAGREWVLRPHARVGGRSAGANATARIYVTLHEGDDETPRCVIVGHVGRKLPDTTT